MATCWRTSESFAHLPKISVITAVLNRSASIENCLLSVANQVDVFVEHIVVDGASTDGTKEILEKWSEELAFWSSEPDRGIADAMNKGLQHATGDWVLFLHSDDELWDEHSLANVTRILQDNQADIVAFPIHFGTRSRSRAIYPRGGNAWLRLKTGLLHQGTFIRCSVFSRVGPHDSSFKIAMDYEFFLRAWLNGVTFAKFSSPTPTLMSDGGVSSRKDWSSLRARFREERRAQMMHSGSYASAFLYATYWAMYIPYRKIRARLSRQH